jgi:DNA-binding CsgD family transcriptional regulator
VAFASFTLNSRQQMVVAFLIGRERASLAYPLSDRELDRAGALMPILLASVDLHGGAKTAIRDPRSGTIVEMQASLKSRHPHMSTRELEVEARVKAGMSARQIAADLGIAETTVITHRKGAYARVVVANLRELLLA